MPVVEFVKELYPRVKYLVTICTGGSIAARAEILGGKRATTNKAAWKEVTPLGPEVDWVSPARRVVDGNIWSSSGVVALLSRLLCCRGYNFVKVAMRRCCDAAILQC